MVRRNAASTFVLVVLLAGIVRAWILLTPPGAGADEPGTSLRAGPLARGQVDGSDIGSDRDGGFPRARLLPPAGSRTVTPFTPRVLVGCAAPALAADANRARCRRAPTSTRSGVTCRAACSVSAGAGADLVGVDRRGGSGDCPCWPERCGSSRSAAAGAAAFSSPSRRWRGRSSPMSIRRRWRSAGESPCGRVCCTAVLVPRRRQHGSPPSAGRPSPCRAVIGLVWACVALVVALGHGGRTTAEWWRSLRRRATNRRSPPRRSSPWVRGVTNDSRVSRFVAAAPLIVVAGEVVRWMLAGTGDDTPWRAARDARCHGGDRRRRRRGRAHPSSRRWTASWRHESSARRATTSSRRSAGAGWLDVPLPAASIVLTCAAIGLLGAGIVGGGLGSGELGGAGLLVSTAAASWLFELFQGNTTGTYWQGRYSLPLLVGVPLLLGVARVPAAAAWRLAWCVGGSALVVLNVAAWAAGARPLGVGLDGSMMPWKPGHDSLAAAAHRRPRRPGRVVGRAGGDPVANLRVGRTRSPRSRPHLIRLVPAVLTHP